MDTNRTSHLCPVCLSGQSTSLFDGEPSPLTTLGWPETRDKALSMKRFPHNFKRCEYCTHIWNSSFSYNDIPYAMNPMQMYNSGHSWMYFIDSISNKIASAGEKTTIVEIGSGDGSFLKHLRERMNDSTALVGFDPATELNSEGLTLIGDYFVPERDIPIFRPSLIIMRHVLEHIIQPRSFLSNIVTNSNKIGLNTKLYIEVPCIDKAFSCRRLNDFFYEHFSHFSSKSFRYLASSVLDGGHEVNLGYGNEVVYCYGNISKTSVTVQPSDDTHQFKHRASQNIKQVNQKISSLLESNRKVAIWGGTGKAAAFFNLYNLPNDLNIMVIDSDVRKQGGYVPGKGYKIESPDALRGGADIILIATQWRAADIANEISMLGINAASILVEYDGDLISVDEYLINH